MKKFFTIAIVSLICVASLTSCKKKWTCGCTVTTAGVAVSSQATDTEKRSKSDAKALCEANNGSITSGGVSETIDCHLK